MLTTPLSQFLFDMLLRTPDTGLAGKVKIRLLIQMQRALARWGDPMVTYTLEGSTLRIPLSHDLPRNRKLLPQYAVNIARIAQQVANKYPDLTIIDIGANVGDTLAILRGAVECPVLCIEGDEKYFRLLEANAAQIANVSLARAYVGDTSETGKWKVNAVQGTAYLAQDETSGQEIALQSLSEILRQHPAFETTSKLIKVDTDGFDVRILTAELPLLKRLKPALFFEYDPHFFGKFGYDGFRIFEALREIGYRDIMFYQNTGDYLLTTELCNQPVLEDLHAYYSNRGALMYCDLCVFHDEDRDLCRDLRAAELAHFARFRAAQNILAPTA